VNPWDDPARPWAFCLYRSLSLQDKLDVQRALGAAAAKCRSSILILPTPTFTTRPFSALRLVLPCHSP
jgi:hypothetical protein